MTVKQCRGTGSPNVARSGRRGRRGEIFKNYNMLYWGVFVFTLRIFFQDYERAVDFYLVDMAFFH